MSHSVVHITTVHRRDDTRIFLKQCRSLAESGRRVTLIAPGDHSTQPEEAQSPRVLALSRPRWRLTRLLFGPLQALRVGLGVKANLYHFHDPELLPAGLLLKFLGKTVVYDAHENVAAQILTKHWVPRSLRPLLSRLVRGIESFISRRLDGVVAATPAIAAQFPPEKTTVVQNFPILEDQPPPRTAPGGKSRGVAYVGALSAQRGAHELLEALGRLEDTDVRLTIAGRFGDAQLESELRAHHAWRRVDFLGWTDQRTIAELLSESNVGVVTFLPAPNHVDAQPNKLFEYMAAGLPVVASDFPLWREIVAGSDCGLLVDPRDPQAISAAIRWLLDHPSPAAEMGERGRKAVQEKYNWLPEYRKLAAMYERLLPCAPSGRSQTRPANAAA